MTLTQEEKTNLLYILPSQSNLKTIALANGILLKSKESGDIFFNEEENDLLKVSISYLDKNNIVPLQCFSLIQKILKGDKKDA